MAFARLEDTFDEDMEHVTDRAFRLAVTAITTSRRKHLSGAYDPTRWDVLVRRVRAKKAHIQELLDEEFLEVVGHTVQVRNYEKYNPLTSTERVKKHRQGVSPSVSQPVSRGVSETPPLVREQARTGSPKPIPSSVGSAKASPTGAAAVVAAYVDACSAGKITPTARGSIAGQAKALLAEGVAEPVLIEAVQRIARGRNTGEALRPVVAEVERGKPERAPSSGNRPKTMAEILDEERALGRIP